MPAGKLIKISIFFVAVFVLAAFIFYQQKKSGEKNAAAPDIPELAQILGTKVQEERLLATRHLVERIGVEQALEILQHSSLPNTGEGHLAVHQIGFHAYKTYGVDAILHCKDYFLSACYHGAIIEAATDQGTDVIKKMTDRCRGFGPRFFQCVHAAGHAINAIWNYDLPSALKTCDDLYDGDNQYPDTLTSCHNGAFMENLFGVHDWGTGQEQKRDWLSSDPYFPCDAMGEKYQKGCWLNQAARIYQMYNLDIQKTANLCDAIGNTQYTDWCLDNLYRQIHPLTESNLTKVTQLCGQLGPQKQQNCIMVNAISYYSVGDKKLGIETCNLLSEPAANFCFIPIINYLAIDNLTPDEKRRLCAEVKGPNAQNCFQRIS